MTDRHGPRHDDLRDDVRDGVRDHRHDDVAARDVSHDGREHGDDGIDDIDDGADGGPDGGEIRSHGRGYDALLAGHDAGGDDSDIDEHDVHDGLFGGHDDHDVHDGLFGGHDDHDDRAPRRDTGRGRRLAVLGAALLVVLAGIVLAFRFIAPIVGDVLEPKDFDGPGSGRASVVVHQGDTGRVIGQTLVDAGVIKTATAFEDALEQNPGDEVQPGTYNLARQMKAVDALSALRSGKARDETTVTVREGMRAAEVYEALSKATGVPVKEYAVAAEKGSALGLPKAANGSLEGYLFPATYTFGPKTGAAAQLKELIGQATGQYSALGVPDAKMHDVITIASIVESEARLPTDRPKVAAVLENRLRIRMPLQLDSTVSYGVGKRTVTTTDADRHDDNPYNTYLHPGLPKGPIGNPGADSVKAALHPASGDWLYFVTINPQTGETAFARTHAEHEANVARFRTWCRQNPGKCN